MFVDAFVQNEGWDQQGSLGSALELMSERGTMWDPGLMRPYLDSKVVPV